MNLYALSALLAVIGDIVIGSVVILKGQNRKLSYFYALMSFAIATWAFGCFGQSVFLDNKSLALIFDKIIYTAAVFAPVIFLNTVYVIRNKKNSFLIYFFYLIASLIVLTNWIIPLRQEFFISTVDLRYGFRFAAVPLLGWWGFVSFYSLVSTVVLIELLIGYLKAVGLEKIRFQYFLVATTFLAFGGYMYLMLIANIYIPQIDNVFHFLYSFIMAYAILKHSLMDIGLIIKKITSYIFSALFIIATFWIAVYYTYSNYWITLITILLLGLFWSFFAIPFKDFLITTARRAFIKGYYNQDEILTDISNKLSVEKNREEIFNILAKDLDTALELEKIEIIVAERNPQNSFKGYKLINVLNNESRKVEGDNLIINTSKITEPTFVKDLTKELQESTKSLGWNKDTLLLPFYSPEMLEGIIVLGERSGKLAYKETDLNFLKRLIKIVDALLYRLTPYEIIENQFNENQKKLYDAERNFARSEKIASLMNTIQEYNHEIRTPLSLLRMTISALKNKDDLENFKKETLGYIDATTEIVDTTLRIAKPKELVLKPQDVNAILKSSLEFIKPSGVILKSNFSDVPFVSGDFEDLKMAFNNLIKNATEAMPKGGDLIVETSFDSNEKMVMVKIQDTGVGILPENIKKIWDPFVSFKASERGVTRGLGLSVVFRIINEHLGHVDVKSDVGKGSIFTVKLPVKN